jgi:GNAT superfamily N-acetyltransferase
VQGEGGEGAGVRLALDEDGRACGMIQYVPAEHSHIEGEGLYFIQCIWVHGHRQGVGNHQRRGMGRALLLAAEEDARSRGAKGMAAWGLSLPFWMPASFYLKHGYRRADRESMAVLVGKPFAEGAVKPKWIKQAKRPKPAKGKVAVTCFVSGWCQVPNIVCERAKRAAAEFGDAVAFEEIDTGVCENLLEWGLSDALHRRETGADRPAPKLRENKGAHREEGQEAEKTAVTDFGQRLEIN